MCGGAQTKHGAAAIEVRGEVLHPCIVRRQKTQEEKHHVRILKHLDAGDIRKTRLDVAVFIEPKGTVHLKP